MSQVWELQRYNGNPAILLQHPTYVLWEQGTYLELKLLAVPADVVPLQVDQNVTLGLAIVRSFLTKFLDFFHDSNVIDSISIRFDNFRFSHAWACKKQKSSHRSFIDNDGFLWWHYYNQP
jgi:hypothetical protein